MEQFDNIPVIIEDGEVYKVIARFDVNGWKIELGRLKGKSIDKILTVVDTTEFGWQKFYSEAGKKVTNEIIAEDTKNRLSSFQIMKATEQKNNFFQYQQDNKLFAGVS